MSDFPDYDLGDLNFDDPAVTDPVVEEPVVTEPAPEMVEVPEATIPVILEPETTSAPAPKEYDTATEDVNWTPPRAMISHLSGMPVTGTFFFQALGRDDEPKAFQPATEEALQQYIMLSNCELRLQSELTFTENPADGDYTVTGTARMYPYRAPNLGDVIVLSAGNNGEMAFTVTARRRLSRMKGSAYEIDFESSFYYDDIRDLLLSRVVQRYVYSREHLNENCMVLESDAVWLRELKKSALALEEKFTYDLLDHRIGTAVIEGETAGIDRLYDGFAVEAFNRVKHVMSRHEEFLEYDCGRERTPFKTLYDFIANPSIGATGMITQMRPVSIYQAGGDRVYRSIKYAEVDAYMWPVNEPTGNEYEKHVSHRELRANLQPALPIPPTVPVEGDETQYVAKATVKSPSDDFYYVLSAAWYQSLPEYYSRLESILDAYLRGQVFNLELLKAEADSLLTETNDLGRVLYHIPLVLTLIRVATRS